MSITTPGFTLDFSRTYNSDNANTTDSTYFGPGWTFGLEGSAKQALQYTYDANGVLHSAPDTSRFIVKLPDGSQCTFAVNGSTYTAQDSRFTLVKQSAGYVDTITGLTTLYILTTKDQHTYGFDPNGNLIWMRDWKLTKL